MTNRLKILFLFVVITSGLHAQLRVKNYFSFSGKKDNPVNVIGQDKLGFLWLGTNEGIYKFDGKQAEEVLKGNKTLKQAITAIYVDINEAVWIGTRSGKVYVLTKNKLDSINLVDNSNTEKITSFCQLESGMCIGTYGNGIYTVFNGRVKHFNNESGLSDDVVYKIESDRSNRIWCGTDAGITEITNIFSKPIFRTISNKNGLPDNIVRDVCYSNNKLLIAMQDSGACYYDLSLNIFLKKVVNGNWSYGSIVNAKGCANNKLLLGTERKGLVEITSNGTRFYDYETYLQTSTINQLFIDNTSQIWLASKRGISHFMENRFNLVKSIKGLANDKILAIACDSTNAIWVGTSMGISKLENGPGSTMLSQAPEYSKFTISCAARAPDGSIWFGSYGNGIIVLSACTKQSILINAQNSGLPNDNISDIYFDHETVYISTLGNGVVKATLQLKDNSCMSITKNYSENTGLSNNYVYSAITDSLSRLFLATDGGGFQMLQNGKFINLTEKFKLSSNTVFSLCKDKYNTVWAISNNDGILKYSHDTLISIGLSAGLRDLQPQQIIAIDNWLYAFNSKGIDKINCSDNSVSYHDFSESDMEPNLNAVFYNNGNIFSGTNKGMLVFRTGRNQTDSIKPTVFIKTLQVNYVFFRVDSIHEFKHRQNNFIIAFDGVWLKNPDRLSFRYKLNGMAEDWQYANTGKSVNYNNLEPGNYTFIVQSKNEEDIWSEPLEYSFRILTPVWKRWWFWVLIVSMVCTVVYSFFRYRISALKRTNALLEQRVAERTREIAQQAGIIKEKNKALEQLSLVASKTDNVVLILDPEGRLEYVNESFLRIHHMSREEFTSTFGETIYEFSNNPHIRELINEAITNKKSINYESINKKVPSFGFESWESSTLTPIFGEDEQLKKIIIIDTNVSETKRQEQIIIQKNKDITDSIYYARKIQQTILPRYDHIKAHLPQSFVLYLTKDIVSGDFYWFTNIDGCSIIAAIDCTGHGVPGAFMSLIGYNVLNRIINENKITNPGNILMELNNGVLAVLHKNESESKDGMDIAICKIDHKNNTLEYAGAMRPLWIISNGELSEIKADKIPIGTKQKDRNEVIAFTTHTLHTKQGDCFYIFTDGYADQFGGSHDKKYSTSRFKELLLKNYAYDFVVQENMIREEHTSWKGKNEQLDDILLVGFSI